MSQHEKKDLLSQFLDITVFDSLYRLANEEIRDVQALLKDFGSTDYSQQLVDSEEKLEKDQERHGEYEGQKATIEEEVKSIQKQVLIKTKSLHKRVPLDDIDNLELEQDLDEYKITMKLSYISKLDNREDSVQINYR